MRPSKIMMVVFVTVLAAAALAACSSSAATTPVPTRGPLTRIATVETSSTAGPIQSIPTMAIETDGKRYPGARASYCWPVEATGTGVLEVCADAIAWSNIEGHTPVGEARGVTLHVESEEPPTKMTAYLFADPSGPAIETIELEAIDVSLSHLESFALAAVVCTAQRPEQTHAEARERLVRRLRERGLLE